MQPSPRYFVKLAAIGLGGLVAATILVVGTISYFHAASICENQVIYERISPNGLLKAVVFSRECGATTGTSAHISVVPRFFGTPSGAGNVFIADSGHASASDGTLFGSNLRVFWVSSFLLRVEHHPAFRVFKAEAKQYGATTDIRSI